MSCPIPVNLIRLAVACEDNSLPTSEFCTDLTGTMSRFLDVPALEGSVQMQLLEEPIEAGVIGSSIDFYSPQGFRPRRAQLSFQTLLYPPGQTAGDTETTCQPDDSAIHRLMFGIFGSHAPAAAVDGTTFVSAADLSTITLTDVTGWEAGQSVGWVNPDGEFETRLIENVNDGTETIILNAPLSVTPTAGDEFYISSTFASAECPECSFQFIYEGKADDDRWLLLGGQISAPPTIERVNGEFPRVSWQITFADWQAMPGATPFAAAATFPKYVPTTINGCFLIEDLTTSTLEEYPVASVALTLNSPVFTPVPTSCGKNGIYRWARTRAVPVATIDVSIPVEHVSTWQARRETAAADGFRFKLWDAMGSQPGLTWISEIAAAQLVNVQHVDEGGLQYIRLSFVAGVDATTTAQTDVSNVAFRMHQL